MSAQRGVSRKSGEPEDSGDHIMIKIKHDHSSGVRYAPGRRYARSPRTVPAAQATQTFTKETNDLERVMKGSRKLCLRIPLYGR